MNIEICGTHTGARQLKLNGAKTVSRLPLCSQSVNGKRLANKWPHLQSAPVADYTDKQPGILIGEDHAFVMAPQRVIKHQPRMPIATKTPLGWVVSGCTADDDADAVSDYAQVNHVCDQSQSLDELHRLVKLSFVMDDCGIISNLEKGRSREDERALVLMESTAKRMGADERRWEIGLLWRDENVKLPDSRVMAMRRLQCLERRLDANPVLRAAYKEKIDDNVAKKYFVRADVNVNDAQRVWFLPHFAFFFL